MSSIGQRLKLWRGFLGLTQSEFAELSKINEAQIKKYEIDISIPGGKVLEKLISTGVNAHWLITGEGEMASQQENLSETPENSALIELPKSLKDKSDRLTAIFNILGEMPDEKRDSFIQEMYKSLQEIKRIDNMEALLKELQRERKTGS